MKTNLKDTVFSTSQPERCPICDWPMADDQSKGCVPGDCSYRPDDPAEQERIRKRRAAIAATPAVGGEPQSPHGNFTERAIKLITEAAGHRDDWGKYEYAIIDLAREADAAQPAASLRGGQIEPRFLALRQRLLHAITTAGNDDVSKPMSEKRERHCERVAAMYVAIDFIDSTLGLASPPEQPAVSPVIPWIDAEEGDMS